MKTPQQSYPRLAAALGLPEVYLKREDLHQYGSHKGRSIPPMIKVYAKGGIRDFVISSSGNAALAAILAVEQYNKNNFERDVRLQVFVGKNIDVKKIDKLSAVGCRLSAITIERVDRPKQSALLYEKEHGAKLLRQSTDDLALEGYHELAEELNKIENLQAIFIPTSSGTTAQALGWAFQEFKQKSQIHIVQTESCNPIASACLSTPSSPVPLFTSIATAIVDRIAHRKDKVIAIVKNSGGAGWIITDDEIRDAIALVKQTTGLNLSPNSALAVAGLKKAAANGFSFSGPALCLITGA